MADSLIRLRISSEEYDNKLKRAAEGLNRYIEECRKAGDTLEYVDNGVKEFTQQLGKMGTVAGGAKGKLGEMTKAFTDLTMQFNTMSEAEKNGQFGKALSSGLDELKQRIISTKQELADINNSLNGGAIGSGSLFSSDKLSGMLQVFGGNLMTKGAGMVMSFAGELKDMVAQGIELAKAGEGVRLAFQRLGRGDILQGLREATHGTVTDLELMKAAVKFNDFKLPLDELGTMLAFAQQKAKDTGQSVDYMVDSIVTGLGRKSLMILDNLGLSASEIKEKMAETGDMTKAVGAIIREQMQKAGDYVETAADRATQANVSLQNKMEELGRKFGPLEQASSNLWTSIKIGIMDIVGGPLTDFLNKLTEAGRLAQKYSVLGGSGKVGRMINNLSGAREGNRQSIYQQQQEQFWRYINPREQQIRDIRAWQRGERGEALQKRVSAITEKYGSLDATKIEAEVDAAKKMLAEYQQSAKQILTPVKANIKTDDAEQNVASLTQKLKDLQEQRKKAIAAGDTELSKNLLKQINQTKADIKGLGGTTTTTTKHQTPQQRAQESFTKAEQNYKQALEQAAMELEAGTITRAEAKKKEMQAAEQRWKAIGDARNISDSPELKQAQNEAAANYKALAAEVKTATERQKAIDKATRDLEQAEKKVADAMEKSADAWRKGDLQGYMQAQKSVGGDVSPAIGSDAFRYTSGNLDAFIGNLKQQLSQADIGSDLYNNLTAQLSDATLLGNLIQTAIKNGIDMTEFNPQELWSKVFGDKPGDYISNEDWQKKLGIISKQTGKKIQFNPQTGEIRDGKKKGSDDLQEFSKDFSAITGSVNGILSGIQNLGIEIPEGLAKTIGAIQTISSILTAILAITSIIQTSSTANATASWIDAIIPFAHGGMIKAFSGTLVGNTYSGDQLRGIDNQGQLYGLNAGEVVLNRAQTGNIASQLQGGNNQQPSGSPYITGEMIFLGLNNYLKSTGRGEMMTSRFKG